MTISRLSLEKSIEKGGNEGEGSQSPEREAPRLEEYQKWYTSAQVNQFKQASVMQQKLIKRLTLAKKHHHVS
jgi:hypothetical protein